MLRLCGRENPDIQPISGSKSPAINPQIAGTP